MNWFDEELNGLKKRMKFSFRDLEYPEETGKVLKPLINVKEVGKDVVVKMKLLGVSRRDISIKLTSEVLEVNAASGDLRYHRKVGLPYVNHNKAKTDFYKGLLVLRIPKN
ncbi:hypothetical protein ACFLZZ_03200 [Nanoarchaeota archaeon]